MDFFEAEKKQNQLVQLIDSYKSPRAVLFEVVDFFHEVTKQESTELYEPFVISILPEVKRLLSKYTPIGIEPQKTNQLLSNIYELNSVDLFKDYVKRWQNEIERINFQVSELEKSLNGWKKEIKNSNTVYFPIIEKYNGNEFAKGLIDSLQVTIIKLKNQNKNEFILHPSAIDVEQKLDTQVYNSWEYAKTYFESVYSRKTSFYKVIINFEKPYAIYEGSSLGIALTIAFISELLNLYQLQHDLKLGNNIVTTGSVDNSANVLSISVEIIKTKVTTVFFSNFSKFVIPKNDLAAAEIQIERLTSLYPNRVLDVIGVDTVQEALNRRDLIDIVPKNYFLWGSKKIIKSKFTLMVIFLSLFISSFLYLSQDLNPASVSISGRRIVVKNKFNSSLWYKEFSIGKKTLENFPNFKDMKSLIVDINNDGENEVLMTNLPNKSEVFLFNSEGEEIWKFGYTDTLRTEREVYSGTYNVIGIVDTVHNGNVKELIIYVQHHSYYPTGLLKLNLLTGEKVGNVVWHSGSICGAKLIDWNKDGIKEIIAGGPANGLNKAYLFSIDHDKLNGQFPTSKYYSFQNIELAQFNKYLTFPLTDYGAHYFPKYNAVMGIPHTYLENQLGISIHEGNANLFEADFSYGVRLDKELKPIKIILGDGNVVFRDNLIHSKVLNPPYTDTPEFHENIMINIEYWDGDKFVKFPTK